MMKFKNSDIVVVKSGNYKDKKGVVTVCYPKYMLSDDVIYMVEFSSHHSGQFREDEIMLSKR